MTTLHLRKSIDQSPLKLVFSLISLAVVWAALLPTTQAADGGLPNNNTAEGTNALNSLTTGKSNTAIGESALFSNTSGNNNTATGVNALLHNNGTGIGGTNNTATGLNALNRNTTGSANTATGAGALFFNDGDNNTADGFEALEKNTIGTDDTAIGEDALFNNMNGQSNTAVGAGALSKSTGDENIAVGDSAGENVTTGSNNIDIGNMGVALDAFTMRLGAAQNATYIAGISGATVPGGVGVIIDSSGHLGTMKSSARFKDEIKPMDKVSEAILALEPVTFRYKHELDPNGIPQFGLVAEQVEKVNPDLVVRGEDGKVMTVRYEAVNAMLLNEFLKEHRKVEEQQSTITRLESKIAKQELTAAQQQKDFQASAAQQQKEIIALTATVKEQASLIRKVSDQLQASRSASQLVVSNE